MPMFPLATVLVPSAGLPLHVFETRLAGVDVDDVGTGHLLFDAHIRGPVVGIEDGVGHFRCSSSGLCRLVPLHGVHVRDVVEPLELDRIAVDRIRNVC